jgi:hypothetical protein
VCGVLYVDGGGDGRNVVRNTSAQLWLECLQRRRHSRSFAVWKGSMGEQRRVRSPVSRQGKGIGKKKTMLSGCRVASDVPNVIKQAYFGNETAETPPLRSKMPLVGQPRNKVDDDSVMLDILPAHATIGERGGMDGGRFRVPSICPGFWNVAIDGVGGGDAFSLPYS